MLYHRKMQNCQNCSKIVLNCSKFVLNSKLGFIFQFMGLGQFSECGLVYCLIWLRKWINIYINIGSPYITIPINHQLTTSFCVCQQSLPDWESGVSSLVCLCHGSVYCASVPAMPEVCQHARGSSWSVCASLDISRGPRCPEGQDIVPLCQMAQTSQDCTYGSDLFVMMIFDCFLSHVMARWLYLSPLIVSLSLFIVWTMFRYGRHCV